MQHKIKKHFSLFMVSKSIRKPCSKKKTQTSEILLQNSSQQALISRSEPIPKFLSPINCIHLYGDICFHNCLKIDGNDEVGLLSNYNHFKKVVNIAIEPNYISLYIEKTTDELHSWEFLISRLNTLNNRDAHELAEVLTNIFILPMQGKENKENAVIDENCDITSDFNKIYQDFCKEIDEYCNTNAETYFSCFRYRICSIAQGLELQEIRHSKKTIEFFSENIDNFTHLILEQGILDVWTVEEKDYFSYMKDSLTNFLCLPQKMSLYATTIEGTKISISAVPFRKIIQTGKINEFVVFMSYEIDDQQLHSVVMRRKAAKEKRGRKSFRDMQLDQILNIYYDDYFEKNIENQDFVQEKIKREEEYGYGNIYLSEKKRCGVKNIIA